MMIKSPGHKATKPQSKHKTILFIFVACVVCLVTYDLFGQPVSSIELIKNAGDYDGKEVVFSGEVIGEVMFRGNNAWVNISDGNNAIGIWLSGDLARNIVFAGSYKTKGDLIEISGIFNRACPEHGGDLDIHARTLKKISSGRALRENINSGKIRTAIIFLGALCLILILRFLSRK